MKKSIWKKIFWDWIEPAITALILAFFIRTFIVQAFKIPTGSMRPTFLEGDRILVNKFIYGARIPLTNLRLPKVRKPERGDIVVFLYDKEGRKDRKNYIKRLIATSGEVAEIVNGNVVVDGEVVKDPRIKSIYYYNTDERGIYGMEGAKVKVPPENYFVLGDNSKNSKDGRYWGFFSRNKLLGKAFLIYWPPRRIGLVE